jgi:hypothetical protein
MRCRIVPRARGGGHWHQRARAGGRAGAHRRLSSLRSRATRRLGRPIPLTQGGPEGASPDYHCFVWGERIGNVPIWFNVTHNGVTGFYSSYFDDSSYQSNEELTAKYGVPLCGSPAPAPNPPPAPSTPPVAKPPAFNRDATQKWALAHAKDKPYDGTSCTWFISQALWQGGLAKTTEWTSAGTHGHIHKEPGSKTAFYTPGFLQYILRTYSHSTYRQLDMSAKGNNVVADAQIGDVIAYDWEGESSSKRFSGIDHAAVITGFASGHYPLVSEWSVDGKKPTPYVSRGWTWSKLSGKWLQSKYPKVQAFLLHIDEG